MFGFEFIMRLRSDPTLMNTPGLTFRTNVILIRNIRNKRIEVRKDMKDKVEDKRVATEEEKGDRRDERRHGGAIRMLE